MNTLHVLVAVGLTLTAGLTSSDDSRQLQEIIKSQQGRLNDVEFIYEGSVKFNRVRADHHDGRPQATSYSFQGIFAFRKDASIHDELYTFKNGDLGKMAKNTICLSQGKVFQNFDSPGRGVPTAGSGMVATGGISSLDRPASPLRFLFLPNLVYSKHYYLDNDCKSMGWEIVDGRNCLRVDFTQGSLKNSYWIDVERGSNPLKYEFSVTEKLRMRAHSISLASVPGKSGDRFWLPVSGVRDSFLNDNLTYSSEPVVTESYKIVDGSIKINQDLPDRRFSIKYSSAPQTALMKRAKSEFATQTLPAIDLGSIDDKLKRLLNEADSQSRQLEATSPAREPWSWTTVYQYGTAALGISLLGIAGIWAYRRR